MSYANKYGNKSNANKITVTGLYWTIGTQAYVVLLIL